MIRTIFTKNTLFVHWSVDGDIEAAIYLKIIQHMSQQPALRPNETFKVCPVVRNQRGRDFT